MKSTVYENISRNRERILSLWQAAVLPQGRGLTLVSVTKSRFTAPAEYMLHQEVGVLFDWLISEEESFKARPALREICRFKAVQALSPSEALGFIVDLKGIIRLVLGGDELTGAQLSELGELDKRIDQLLLLAFDEYSEYREQIMEIKIDEVRRLTGITQRCAQ